MKLKQIVSTGLSIAILTSQLGSVSAMAEDTNITVSLPEQSVSDTATPSIPPLENQPPIHEPATVPTHEPSAPPVLQPTPAPTEKPSAPPVENPTDTPTPEPSAPPVENPTDTPTQEPSAPPVEQPTPAPTEKPSAPPVENPTDTPAQEPSAPPVEQPTPAPTEKPSAPPMENPTDTPAQEPSAPPVEQPTPAPAEESKVPTEKSLIMSAALDDDLASVGGGTIEYYGGGDPRVEIYTKSSSRIYGDPYVPNGIIIRCYGITEGQVSMADFATATYSIGSTDGTAQNSKTPVGKYNTYCTSNLSDIIVDGKTIKISSGVGYTSGEVVVNKRSITISADSKQKTYGDADPTLTYTVSSGSIVPGDTMLGTLFREKAGPATEGVGVYDIKSTLSNSNYVISYIPAKLEIIRANLSVSVSTPLGRTVTLEYGAIVPEVSFVISGLKNNDTVNNEGGGNNLGTVKVACTATNDSVPGNYPITVSGLGTSLANYNISYINGNIQIIRRTVMATANGYTKTYSETDKELTATVTAPNAAKPSAPDISDSGTAMFPLKYTLSRVLGEAVGNYPISINVDAASRQYYDVRYTAADVVIAPAALTITTNPSTREYGDPNPVFSVSYSGFMNGENESVLGGTLSYFTSAVRESFVGSYPVMPSGLTSSNYTIQFLPGDLVVEKRNVEAHMVATGKMYGQQDGPMAYTLPEAVIDPVNSPLVGTPLRIPGENVGTYKMMANFPNKNYKVQVITADFTITPAPLVATVNDATRQYGNDNPTFSVRYDGFVRGDTGAAVTGTPVFTTLSNPKSPVGNYPVAITGGLSARNYTISFAPGNLSVTQRKLTVMIDDKTQVYGAGEKALTYTLSEPLVDPENSPLTISMQRKPGTSVGKYAITGTATNPNYDLNVKDGLYTITAADLVVQVNDAVRKYGDENPTFTVSYEGLQLGDVPDALTGKLVFDTAATRTSSVGDYPVTVSGLASGNYNIEFTPGTLTVEQRALTVTLEDKTQVYGAEEKPLTYALSESLIDPVGSPLTVSMQRVPGTDVGSYPITGTFTNSNYSIKVDKGTYSITPAALNILVADESRKYGDENPDFKVTYDGLQLGDTSAALNGTLKFTTAADKKSPVGDYAVTASGVSSKNYIITFENGTLTIDPRPITVTADSKTVVYGDKEAELTYTLSEKEIDPENNPLIVTLEKPDGKDANAYIITVTAENKNYDITVVPGIYVIQPAPLVIKVVDKERPHGAENPTFEVTYDGFKNDEDNKVLNGELVFKTDANTNSDGGKYTVSVGGVSGKNYTITFKDGALTVQPAPEPTPEVPKKPASGNPETGNGFLETYPLAAPIAGLLATSSVAGAWQLYKKRKKKPSKKQESDADEI